MKNFPFFSMALIAALAFYGYLFREDDWPIGSFRKAIKTKNDVQLAVLLREFKERVNLLDSSGNSLLMIAASAGNKEAVKLLLKEVKDINRRNSEGKTALMLAAEAGAKDVVQELVGNGADVKLSDGNHCTALDYAQSARHKDIVDYLRELGSSSSEERSRVRILVSEGKLRELNELLKQGIDPDALAPDGTSALMVAASLCSVNAVSVLLEYGADPDRQRTAGGETALMLASDKGCLEVVELLLRHGADPRVPRADNLTAIDFAKATGRKEVEDFLKNNGVADAELNYRLRLAIEAGEVSEVEKLLNMGADIKHRLFSGETPLVVSVTAKRPEIAAVLIKHGVNVNAALITGETPLMLACKKNDLATVELLIQAGADVNAAIGSSSKRQGETPLLIAARKGNLEIIQVLLRAGSDPAAQTLAGRTPLKAAELSRNAEAHAVILDALRKRQGQ